MKIFWKHLLLCTLIALLSGNAAERFLPHEDILTRYADLTHDNGSIDYRLPISVAPISYEIILVPDLQNFTFEGIVKINAMVKSPTDMITLHVGNIKIKSHSVLQLNNTKNLYEKHIYDNVTEKYTLFLSSNLTEEMKILIVLSYNGILNDNLIGFYKSSYIDKNGQVKWLAATQFHATHARHAFPCFDEPSFKATFQIRIARHENHICLSNMPLNKTEKLGDVLWDTFQMSVPMSTYLVAFVISEFHSLQQNEFKVWARPVAVNQADYALKIGTTALEILSDIFQLKYGLPKMDMVAVPDFAAGAMENWGLVLYRETRMLYDKRESSALAQQTVASVVLHELTHMWFGNLVTPEWWSYLWLSEAFASYFQYFGTAEIETTWNMKEQFVVEQHQAALITDSLESSRPMTREVSSQSQIGGMGDSITYSKGASIVRMMSLIFGSNIFKPALRDYLKNNKEKGLVNPDALWTTLQNQVNLTRPTPLISVKTIMDTWTTQAGYPVVSVTVNDKNIRVTQQRLLLRNLGETPTNVTWWVPLTWTTQSKPNFDDTATKYWLYTKEHTIDLTVNSKEWMIFNIQSSGFYRVNYDYDGWQRILNALNSNKFEEIHVLNRAAIIDDLLNLARTEYLEYEMALDGISYLKRETNYLPFKAAFNGLDYLNKRLAGHKEHILFKKYVLSLIKERRKKLGYEDRIDDDRLTVLLRREINDWACNFDDEECVMIYVNKFKKWKANTSLSIKPNERTTAYCIAIKYGTSEDWEFLWKQYYNSNNAADQIVIINALGCSLNTTVLEKYLEYAISSYQTNRIRKQDSRNVFAAIYGSSLVGAEYILDFVEKHYKDMEKYYGGQDVIATILDEASQRFSTLGLVNRFQDFIERHKTEFAPIRESLASSLKVARYELKWYESASVPIIRWLEEYEPIKYRLPTNIRPTKYTIFITPHLVTGNFTFDGKVEIKADVVEATKRIVLHSAEIKHNAPVVIANETELSVETIVNEHKYDFYIINLTEELKAGTNLTIEIAYTGHLNASDLRGFYKSSYVNETGETRWLAATHLEPVGARKLFPCFDEPALKAQFTVQVSVPSDYHVFSNMELADLIDEDNGNQLFVFNESVKMSTYLVAIVVSDFKYTSMEIDGVKYRVFARPDATNQTKYALSVMDTFVHFFEDKFKQKYQISKLDMVALPDFPSGAMENWGLLTYKETNLLYDEDHSSSLNKQTIRNVIAHEIAHQWFGNLVSMSWWKYLWLNEGFARYFQYHASDVIFNDETMEPQFVVDQVHSALSADSSSSTHAMSHDVYNPSEIRSIFDSISYAKAASILRMIEKSYGNTVFYNALADYLNKRKYDVATPKDLYEALQIQIDKANGTDNIIDILNTWTTQPGYPVVHAEFTNRSIILKQERFFIKKLKDDASNDVIWHIPITLVKPYQSNNRNTIPKIWFAKKETKIQKEAGRFSDLAVLNVMQSGFYRVNYDEKHWLRLINHFQNSDFAEFDPINRAALVDDLMNLARAGYVDYRIVISALTYLKRDLSYPAWRAFYNNLAYLNNRLRGRDMEDLFKTYLLSLVKSLYSRIGFEDGPSDTNSVSLYNLLKFYTREWACKLNIGDCRFHAAKYFLQLRNSKTITIPPSYRSVVYCTAMRTDITETSYNLLWKEYLNSNVTVDKLVILSSLTCSENKDILETLLLAAVTENSHIRYQDSAKVFSDVYDASLIGIEVVMDVIEKHYDIIYNYFGDYTKIKNIVSSLASRLSTYNLYHKYRNLLDWLVKKEPAFEKSVDSFVENAEYEFEWYEREGPKIFAGIDTILQNNEYRLPNTLYPELYKVSLVVDIENATFEGTVQIYMKVEKNTSAILLNSHNLNIMAVRVFRHYEVESYDSKFEEIPLLNYKEIPSFQQLKIYLSKYANTEKIMAEIEFRGILNDNMQGFYRSSYLDSNGKRHWLATTQFEPTHARKVFPCFDEPAFKSKFIINITRPSGYHTLSNMPISKQVPSSSKERYTCDIFHTTTKVMSPYLVAFVVSEFESVENSKELINVWGRPEVAKHGSYAQNVAKSLITTLQNYLSIDYALPKLDLVGIPDFSMGAMENWGLATFREYGLFHSKNVTTATYEKYIITIIAHELAHMWFGNLVTCQWWDYIWLNEGFAEYLQWVAADMIRPSYNFMEQFVVYELQPALRKDSSPSAHPMTNPVQTPEEINGIFDYVTYGKSASVLRMIFSAYSGTITQQSLLSDYLKKYEDGTTRPADLWEFFKTLKSLDGKQYENIKEMMDTWTNQPGYPVVHANLDGSTLTLTQERFQIPRSTSSEFYWIPIHVEKSSDSSYITLESDLWLGREPKTMYINPTNEWFIVNYQQIGFYRVNYDILSWKRLINTLDDNTRFESIHSTSRAQIIDDLFNLALSGYVDYELVMNATKYLTHERNHLPWKAFFNGLSYVYERFETNSLQPVLTEYILNLTSAIYDKVGFDDISDEQYLDELNREMILQWACKLNKKQCVERSLELFTAWRNGTSKQIPRNAHAAVYCTAIRNGTWEDWDFLWKQYLQTNFVSEKMVILNALGCSTNKFTLQDYLLTTIRNDVLRKQDIKTVFASVYTASQLGVDIVLDFLIIYLEDIQIRFGNWDDVGNLFYEMASHISTDKSYNKLYDFYIRKSSNFPEIRDKLDASKNIAYDNLSWFRRYKYTIIEWIQRMNEKKDNKGDDGYTIMPLNVVFVTIVALIPYFLIQN